MSAPEWTIEQWIEHGREWVRAGWKWTPGQVAIVFDRAFVLVAVVARVVDGKPYFHETLPDKAGTIWSWSPCTRLDAVPDLRNRGTCGHALEDVRAAWGGAPIRLSYEDDGVEVEVERPNQQHENGFGPAWFPVGCGANDGEALLDARRAAP